MHVHQSLVEGRRAAVRGRRVRRHQPRCGLNYIGGILKHAPAAVALRGPDYQLLQRLVPGFEAPVNLAYFQPQPQRPRCASPCNSPSPKAKRIEVRFPDPSATATWPFSAMLMAGPGDGIENRIDPGEPLGQGHLRPDAGGTQQRFPLGAGFAGRRPRRAGAGSRLSCSRATCSPRRHRPVARLQALNEVDEGALRPHPYEFKLYFDI